MSNMGTTQTKKTLAEELMELSDAFEKARVSDRSTIICVKTCKGTFQFQRAGKGDRVLVRKV